MENFNIRLKKALAINNMKPIELASKLNINKGIISNYLNDKYKPKADRIFEISIILKVNVSWLLGYDVPMQEKEWSKQELLEKIEELVNNSVLNEMDKNKIIEDVRYICMR